MKVLVTGGSGFIGTNLIESLLSNNCKILNIDNSAPKKKEHESFWEKIDMINYEDFVEAILRFKPDYIVHLAARTDLDGHSLKDYAVNIIGIENLMKNIHKFSNLRKIIITSSMLVCRAGYYPKNQFDYTPTTFYGESKVETERIVWANKPDCDWAIIRPTSIWGPWFGVPYRNFFDMVLSRRYFHVGNKGCTKTYGYIGNAVYQIEQILFNDTFDEGKKIFYIGDEPPANIEEWADEIAVESGYNIKRIPYGFMKLAACFGDSLKLLGIKFPMTSFRLKNMTTNNIIDLSETYKIAPYPPYSRQEGIKETLEWLSNL